MGNTQKVENKQVQINLSPIITIDNKIYDINITNQHWFLFSDNDTYSYLYPNMKDLNSSVLLKQLNDTKSYSIEYDKNIPKIIITIKDMNLMLEFIGIRKRYLSQKIFPGGKELEIQRIAVGKYYKLPSFDKLVEECNKYIIDTHGSRMRYRGYDIFYIIRDIIQEKESKIEEVSVLSENKSEELSENIFLGKKLVVMYNNVKYLFDEKIRIGSGMWNSLFCICYTKNSKECKLQTILSKHFPLGDCKIECKCCNKNDFDYVNMDYAKVILSQKIQMYKKNIFTFNPFEQKMEVLLIHKYMELILNALSHDGMQCIKFSKHFNNFINYYYNSDIQYEYIFVYCCIIDEVYYDWNTGETITDFSNVWYASDIYCHILDYHQTEVQFQLLIVRHMFSV